VQRSWMNQNQVKDAGHATHAEVPWGSSS